MHQISRPDVVVHGDMVTRASSTLVLQLRVVHVLWLSVLLVEHTDAPVLAASVISHVKRMFFYTKKKWLMMQIHFFFGQDFDTAFMQEYTELYRPI